MSMLRMCISLSFLCFAIYSAWLSKYDQATYFVVISLYFKIKVEL